MKKVAGYARVSTVDQALKGTSAEEQRSIIEKACKAQGNKLYMFYNDNGISGKNDNRPFNIDFNKIESLISVLNKKELLSSDVI